jgi:hypothetical protein
MYGHQFCLSSFIGEISISAAVKPPILLQVFPTEHVIQSFLGLSSLTRIFLFQLPFLVLSSLATISVAYND